MGELYFENETIQIYLEKDDDGEVVKNMWTVFVNGERNYAIENALPTYFYPKNEELLSILSKG